MKGRCGCGFSLAGWPFSARVFLLGRLVKGWGCHGPLSTALQGESSKGIDGCGSKGPRVWKREADAPGALAGPPGAQSWPSPKASRLRRHFERACQEKGIELFVLPPRSPKLNPPRRVFDGQVERAHRTHSEEFWECYDGDLDLASVRPALLVWEEVYNTVRPHQALGWRTPREYISQCHPETASLARLSQMY